MQLNELEKSVEKITSTPAGDISTTPSSNLDKIKNNLKKCIKTPYIYFIFIYFVVCAILIYIKPCYVLEDSIEKDLESQLSIKKLILSTLFIGTLLCFGSHSYII